MTAIRSLETLSTICLTARSHMPEDRSADTHKLRHTQLIQRCNKRQLSPSSITSSLLHPLSLPPFCTLLTDISLGRIRKFTSNIKRNVELHLRTSIVSLLNQQIHGKPDCNKNIIKSCNVANLYEKKLITALLQDMDVNMYTKPTASNFNNF